MNVENEKGFLCRPEIIQDVLDTMAAGLFVTNAEGEVLCWNRGAERVTGFAGEQTRRGTIPAAAGTACISVFICVNLRPSVVSKKRAS